MRIDVGTITPIRGNDGKTELRATPTQQLVIPLEGFMRVFDMQENVIKKLVADGALKPRLPAAETNVTKGSTAAQ